MGSRVDHSQDMAHRTMTIGAATARLMNIEASVITAMTTGAGTSAMVTGEIMTGGMDTVMDATEIELVAAGRQAIGF